MISTRYLTHNEDFFLKRFASIHIIRKLGFQVLDLSIKAFQADKYKKHDMIYSEILTIMNICIENPDSLREMIDAINVDSSLRQVFGYVKPVQ